jgi:hypothetical protein
MLLSAVKRFASASHRGLEMIEAKPGNKAGMRQLAKNERHRKRIGAGVLRAE